MPNLTAKVGRFHVRFGRQNILHAHDLPTTDPPFVNQAFLAPEALTDAGLSLSYVIPPALVGNQYIEVVEEILAGEGASSDAPVFGGDIELVLNKRCLIGAFPWRYEGLEGCPCRIVAFLDTGDNSVEAVGNAAKAILARG